MPFINASQALRQIILLLHTDTTDVAMSTIVFCQTSLNYGQRGRIICPHKIPKMKRLGAIREDRCLGKRRFPVLWCISSLSNENEVPQHRNDPKDETSLYLPVSSDKDYWFMNVNDRWGFDVPLKVVAPPLPLSSECFIKTTLAAVGKSKAWCMKLGVSSSCPAIFIHCCVLSGSWFPALHCILKSSGKYNTQKNKLSRNINSKSSLAIKKRNYTRSKILIPLEALLWNHCSCGILDSHWRLIVVTA